MTVKNSYHALVKINSSDREGNKLMLKNLIFKMAVIVFVFALFVTPAGATEIEGVGNGVENRAPITSLSLEESIRIAVENSSDIAIAEIEHDQALADLRQARRGARSILRLWWEGFPQTYDVLLAERVWPKTAEMLERLSYKNLEITTNLLKFNVENAYYRVLRAEMELQNARDSLSRAREQLRIINLGYEAGVNSRADVFASENLVASQGLIVMFAENSLRLARMDFNNYLGLPLNYEITLTSSFEFTPIEFNFYEIKERARERDITYILLHKNYEIQRETFIVAGEFYVPIVYAYQEARRNYNIAKLELQVADQDLELRIRSALLNMETARERFNLVEQSLEQARESYRLTSLRFEVGMATFLEIERASGEIDNAKAELLSAIYDYNLVVASIRHGFF